MPTSHRVPPRSHLRKMAARLDKIEANPLHEFLRPGKENRGKLPDKVSRRLYMEQHDRLLKDLRKLLDDLMEREA